MTTEHSIKEKRREGKVLRVLGLCPRESVDEKRFVNKKNKIVKPFL
jgi:hypothetical protein